MQVLEVVCKNRRRQLLFNWSLSHISLSSNALCGESTNSPYTNLIMRPQFDARNRRQVELVRSLLSFKNFSYGNLSFLRTQNPKSWFAVSSMSRTFALRCKSLKTMKVDAINCSHAEKLWFWCKHHEMALSSLSSLPTSHFSSPTCCKCHKVSPKLCSSSNDKYLWYP